MHYSTQTVLLHLVMGDCASCWPEYSQRGQVKCHYYEWLVPLNFYLILQIPRYWAW